MCIYTCVYTYPACSHPVFDAVRVGVPVHERGGGDIIRHSPHPLSGRQLLHRLATSRYIGCDLNPSPPLSTPFTHFEPTI